MPDWAKLLITLTVVCLMGAAVGAAVLAWRAAERTNATTGAILDDVREELRALQRQQSLAQDSADVRHRAQLAELRAVERALSDSLRRVRGAIPAPDSTVRDSLRYWHATAVVLESELIHTTRALAVADSEVVTLTVSLARVTSERDTAWSDRDAFRDGVAQLRADIARLPQRCRIAWTVPCPSRTTTFVAGAAATAITLLAVK